jgi:hypothetical protein
MTLPHLSNSGPPLLPGLMRRCGQGQALTVPEVLRRLKDPAGLDPTVTSRVVSRMSSVESPTLNARTVQHNAAMWWSRASGSLQTFGNHHTNSSPFRVAGCWTE